MSKLTYTVGKSVVYTLTEEDVGRVKDRRRSLASLSNRFGDKAFYDASQDLYKGYGDMLPRGNEPVAGLTLPARITGMYRECGVNLYNLVVNMDGDDTLWVTGAKQDAAFSPSPGRWMELDELDVDDPPATHTHPPHTHTHTHTPAHTQQDSCNADNDGGLNMIDVLVGSADHITLTFKDAEQADRIARKVMHYSPVPAVYGGYVMWVVTHIPGERLELELKRVQKP